MRRAAIAQALIALVTTQDRAAAVVGDLLEHESHGGHSWFWWTVAGATLAFAWLNIVRFIFRRHASSGGQGMDFWRFVWRRKWLLVVPTVVTTVAATILAYLMPVTYRAEARLIVVPQGLADGLVPALTKPGLEMQLSSMKQQVLSRTRLQQIVENFNLYEEERQTQKMDDVIQRMRYRDIWIETIPNGDNDAKVVTVSFQSSDPETAQRVTEKLTSLFIDGNFEERARSADNTTMFLDSQIDDLAVQVDASAARIEKDQLAHRTPRRSESIEYEELQNAYRGLLGKRQQARIAANIENRQIGEQLRVLDPARIPPRPEGPERLNISLFGAGAGLAVGLLLMLVASMRRPAPPAPPLVSTEAPVAE